MSKRDQELDPAIPQGSGPQLERSPGSGGKSGIFRLFAPHGHMLANVVTLIVFCVALWLSHHEFRSVRAEDILHRFRSLPLRLVGLHPSESGGYIASATAVGVQ